MNFGAVGEQSLGGGQTEGALLCNWVIIRSMPLLPPVTTAVTWETSKIFELSRKVLSALPVVILGVSFFCI